MEMKKSMSSILRDRLMAKGLPYKATDNIAMCIESDVERDALKEEVEAKVESLLESLVIDVKHDPNVQKTAHRIAKMYLNEVFYGRYFCCPEISDYPNEYENDEIYILGPLSLRSSCSHHFVPVIGKTWIGIVAGKKVLGISKFSRLLNWMMKRPHMQEEATVLFGKLLEEKTDSKGIAVVIEAKHYCMHWRGVQEESTRMRTTYYSGILRHDLQKQRDFLLKVSSM